MADDHDPPHLSSVSFAGKFLAWLRRDVSYMASRYSARIPVHLDADVQLSVSCHSAQMALAQPVIKIAAGLWAGALTPATLVGTHRTHPIQFQLWRNFASLSAAVSARFAQPLAAQAKRALLSDLVAATLRSLCADSLAASAIRSIQPQVAGQAGRWLGEPDSGSSISGFLPAGRPVRRDALRPTTCCSVSRDSLRPTARRLVRRAALRPTIRRHVLVVGFWAGPYPIPGVSPSIRRWSGVPRAAVVTGRRRVGLRASAGGCGIRKLTARVRLVVVESLTCCVRRFHFSPLSDPDDRAVLSLPARQRRTRKRSKPRSVPRPPDFAKIPLSQRLYWILLPPLPELFPDLRSKRPPIRYQEAGIGWLSKRESALLADEMGLGKTMQAILAARLLWMAGQVRSILIVCPASLIANWLHELELFWPAARQHAALLTEVAGIGQHRRKHGALIYLVSYESLRLYRHRDLPRSACRKYDLMLIDEAQRIKNAGTQSADAVKQIAAVRRWALTGTPIENRTEDLRSIMEYLLGKLPPSMAADVSPEDLGRAVAPYFLRRTLDDVRDDLAKHGMHIPPIVDQDVFVEMSKKQREAYEHLQASGVTELNRRGAKITVTHVFALITELLKICNFRAGHSAKMDLLGDELETARANKRKALVFSRFTSPEFGLQAIRAGLADRHIAAELISGDVPVKARQHVIREFTTRPELTAMVLQYVAGGVGLNLQAAQYVYLFDRWWNPAVEDQAVKRAHRIGQKNEVIVRRFVTKDSIEERIWERLRAKRRLFKQVVDKATANAHPDQAMGLSEEEYFSLFEGLKARPKRNKRKRR